MCTGGTRCHGANKYGPIDRRVREEEEKKRRGVEGRGRGGDRRGGLASVGRPARLAAHRPRRTINTPRAVSRIIKE